MVERVARAIELSFCDNSLSIFNVEDNGKRMVICARAAIQAMREPLPSMEAAGHRQLAECAAMPGGCTMTPACVWSAMIDRSLS